MKKIIRGITLGLIMTCASSTTSFADPLSDQLKNQQNQLQKDKEALKNVQTENNNLEINIEHLDNEIEEIMSEIDENKKKIIKSEDAIKKSEQNINTIEKELKDEQELFDTRMKALYINGINEYIEAVLSSNGISELITRIDTVIKIIQMDKKIVNDLSTKKEEVSEKKTALDAEKTKLLGIKEENESKLSKLNENIGEQKKQIQKLKKQEKVFASKVKESQTLVNTTLKQVEDIRKNAPKMSLSRGAAPISDNNIIAYATNFLGIPYKWGGTTPTGGFDCSGFTQYVFRHFGISLGRTTYDQIHNGVTVSKEELQPGDLVFFGSWRNPSHMGIYMGNNTYIHAPQTGDVVKVSPMLRTDYITARRVK